MTLTVPSPRAGLAAVILALLLLPAPSSARQGPTFAVDPQGASSARGYYVFDAAGGNCAGAPVNSTAYPLTIPTGAPVTFFNAAGGTSLGNYNVIPTVRVDVPANARAGSYTTTITTALVAGP
jgi:hypothetical protein